MFRTFKRTFVLILILALGILIRAYLINVFFPTNILTDRLFLFEISNINFVLPYWLMTIFGIFNVVLIWFIAKLVWNERIGYLASLLYSISPWTSYLDVFGSIYIFLLFFLLLFYLSIFYLLKDSNSKFLYLLIISEGVLLFTCFYMWIIVPSSLFVFLKGKMKLVKFNLLLIVVLFVFIAFFRQQAFLNIYSNEVRLYRDVGLINTVNNLRGELNSGNGNKFVLVSKVVENRYFYLGLHLLFNTMEHFVPVTYFTNKYKLLNFSFSSPIMIGFIIPLFLGVFYLIKNFKKKYILFGVLIIPSVTSFPSPDLTRAVLIAPILFFIIALGIDHLLLSKKNKIFLSISILMVGLLFMESIVSIVDIKTHDSARLESIRSYK